MNATIRLASVVVATGLLGACGQHQPLVNEAEAGQQTSSSQARAATPPASSRFTETVAPRSAYSSQLTVPEGTTVHVTLSSPVNSGTSQVGDDLTATTTSSVMVAGRVAIPSGSIMRGHVSDVTPATKGLDISEKGGTVVLSFSKVTTPAGDSSSMSGTITSIAKSDGKTAGIIGGSAAGGALLGKLLGGHTKDAAIGAVAGAGIGTGIAAGTKGKEVKIPAGTALAITLDRSLSLADRS